jgi:hypothetical protein
MKKKKKKKEKDQKLTYSSQISITHFILDPWIGPQAF